MAIIANAVVFLFTIYMKNRGGIYKRIAICLFAITAALYFISLINMDNIECFGFDFPCIEIINVVVQGAFFGFLFAFGAKKRS